VGCEIPELIDKTNRRGGAEIRASIKGGGRLKAMSSPFQKDKREKRRKKKSLKKMGKRGGGRGAGEHRLSFVVG